MARVRVEPAGVEVSVPAGERLLDVIDDHPELGLVVSCRDANCGTCLIAVEAGAGCLAPAAERELRELRLRRASADERLGCQICITSDSASEELLVLRAHARST